ncbi:MAG TPA: hypothetical protein VNY27_12080 [Solirubrobacteraceae bacterium]|jgi:hypothetical protein|nr:hypothetical protein [Solirubrobacteraceae bacterium]
MPTYDGPERRFTVGVDDILFDEDLAHTTAAGRAAVAPLIGRLKNTGVPKSWLKGCQAESRDGTRLTGCVKIYVPRPAGKFGMVFKVIDVDGRLRLEFLAFGVRHHPVGSHAPTVYEIAHRRLNA